MSLEENVVLETAESKLDFGIDCFSFLKLNNLKLEAVAWLFCQDMKMLGVLVEADTNSGV